MTTEKSQPYPYENRMFCTEEVHRKLPTEGIHIVCFCFTVLYNGRNTFYGTVMIEYDGFQFNSDLLHI